MPVVFVLLAIVPVYVAFVLLVALKRTLQDIATDLRAIRKLMEEERDERRIARFRAEHPNGIQ